MEELDSEVCEVCYNKSMVEVGGSLVCSVCGAQSQAYNEETQDAFETGGGRFKTTVRFKKEKVLHQRDLEPQVGEVMEAYCSALQETLMVLGKILGLEYGVGPALPSVIRRIWFARLMTLKVLEPSFAAGRIAKHANMSKDEVEGRELERVELRFLFQETRKVLYPDVVLDVLLLALLYLGAPVTPMDLLGRALSGELPYFSELHKASRVHDPHNRYMLASMVDKTGISGTTITLRRAAGLAARVDMPLPAINAEALVQHYCIDLCLPIDLCPSVLGIVECYRAADIGLNLTLDPFRNPWAQLMAMLVIVTKTFHIQSPGPSVPGSNSPAEGERDVFGSPNRPVQPPTTDANSPENLPGSGHHNGIFNTPEKLSARKGHHNVRGRGSAEGGFSSRSKLTFSQDDTSWSRGGSQSQQRTAWQRRKKDARDPLGFTGKVVISKRWAKHRLKEFSHRQPMGPLQGVRPYADPLLARRELNASLLNSRRPPKGAQEMLDSLLAISAEAHAQDDMSEDKDCDDEEQECSNDQKLAYLILVAASYCWVTPDFMERLVVNVENELIKIEDLMLGPDEDH